PPASTPFPYPTLFRSRRGRARRAGRRGTGPTAFPKVRCPGGSPAPEAVHDATTARCPKHQAVRVPRARGTPADLRGTCRRDVVGAEEHTAELQSRGDL